MVQTLGGAGLNVLHPLVGYLNIQSYIVLVFFALLSKLNIKFCSFLLSCSLVDNSVLALFVTHFLLRSVSWVCLR